MDTSQLFSSAMYKHISYRALQVESIVNHSNVFELCCMLDNDDDEELGSREFLVVDHIYSFF